jgi:hypothetical protein
MDVGALEAPTIEERAMQTITTIGLDIAKSVFQVHSIDAGGQVIVRWQLKRRYVRLCAPLVARAPGTGSHRAVDAACLCEALPQAAEERCD